MTRSYPKKVKLGVYGRRTRWAPVWAVVRKFGQGKKKHPSEMTAEKRSWKRSKLKIKPRKGKKKHLG